MQENAKALRNYENYPIDINLSAELKLLHGNGSGFATKRTVVDLNGPDKTEEMRMLSSDQGLSIIGSKPSRFAVVVCTLFCFLHGGQIVAADAHSAVTFYETKIAPILKQRCHECHSNDTGKAEGGLVLDSRSGWEHGGDSGAILIPGKSDESLLIQAIRYDDENLQMPPEAKLPAEEIALLEKWVNMGALDPRKSLHKSYEGDENSFGLKLFNKYCFDCHDRELKKGNLNLSEAFSLESYDGTHVFENLIIDKMPPSNKSQPTAREKHLMLDWLSNGQLAVETSGYRRLSRHEFVNSVNDLLGTDLDFADKIPEDRGTHKYDSNHKIALTKELLESYFAVADEMLEYALPEKGFHEETSWLIRPKLPIFNTYAVHAKKYQDGMLFACLRSNNGNVYPFFYDQFKAPVKGHYRVSVDAAKVGDFKEDIGIVIYAGKYFFNDANPQQQRLLNIVSVGDKDVKTYSFEVFLNEGDELSVHCYSKHTLKLPNPEIGAYIKQINVNGPLLDKRLIQVDSESIAQVKTGIQQFAERAFCRALSDKDLEPYYALAESDFSENKSFLSATKISLKAILCSPRFLQVPVTQEYVQQHKNYRIASDLARMLWLSVPDQELLSLAKNEQELSPEILTSEINRMLNDPKAGRMIQSLCNQWLNLKSFNRISPSLSLYPGYSDLVNYYLPLETELYLTHLIQNDLPVTHLIDSDYSFLNQRLAQHYGIDNVIGQKMRLIQFPPNSQRGGLLTMGAILKVTSDGFTTSPILRGAWISKNIVGTPLSPPPEDVEVLEADLSKAETLKEQLAAHRHNKSCNACHKDIDPYGFALESFDATGQVRSKYRIIQDHKATFIWRPAGYFKETQNVDSTGEIYNESFKDINGLKKVLLAKHKGIAYNFAKNFFEFTNGYQPNLRQRIDIYAMIPDQAENCRMRDLITKLMVYSLLGDKDEIQ